MGEAANIWLYLVLVTSSVALIDYLARPSQESLDAVVILPGDADFWHDFEGETDTDVAAAAGVTLAAAVFSVAVLVVAADDNITSLYKHHVAAAVLAAPVAAYGVSAVLNSALRIPRPDFMARCAPAMSSAELMLFPTYTSTVGALCDGDEDDVAEGLRGWPSCHAAVAFAVLWVVCGVSAVMVHSCKIRGGGRWAAVFALNVTLLAAAVYCAWSRVVDNLHSESAVIVGALVGILCAHFVLVFILPYRDVVERPIRVERRATLFDLMTRL